MSMKSYNTFKEIFQQKISWETVYDDIIENKKLNQEIFKKSYDQIIFFGCGSSYNLSQSAAFFSRYISKDLNSIALPSSELLINPDIYIRDSNKYLLIGFSRSGETTESIEVLNNMKDKKNVSLFTFTCNMESSFSKISRQNFVCRNATEKSIVMTTSFSSMLLASCIIFALSYNNIEILEDFKLIIEYINENLDTMIDFTKNYTNDIDFESYFVLGSGFNYGLALEAGLKMQEMSQTPSYSYHVHEFSHGPKSLLNDNSLSVILTPSKKIFKFENIINEFVSLGTNMLIIGIKPEFDFKDKSINKKITYFLEINNVKNEIIKSFINIPVFQLIAFFNTLKKKLNPDLPNNLSYTVKI